MSPPLWVWGDSKKADSAAMVRSRVKAKRQLPFTADLLTPASQGFSTIRYIIWLQDGLGYII